MGHKIGLHTSHSFPSVLSLSVLILCAGWLEVSVGLESSIYALFVNNFFVDFTTVVAR